MEPGTQLQLGDNGPQIPIGCTTISKSSTTAITSELEVYWQFYVHLFADVITKFHAFSQTVVGNDLLTFYKFACGNLTQRGRESKVASAGPCTSLKLGGD